MQVAVVQLDITDGDYEGNFAKVAAVIARLGPDHDLIVLPEAVTTGFAARADVERHAEPLSGPTVTALRQWSATHNTTIVCGLVEHAEEQLYNSAVIVSHGDLLLTHRKVQLWRADQTLFAAGDQLQTAPWHGTRLGALICFDVEFPEPARGLAAAGAGVVAVCNGNMEPYGPPQRVLAQARAIENHVFVAAANRVGQGRVDRFAGGSLIISPAGRLLAAAGEAGEAILSTTIDLTDIAAARAAFTYAHMIRTDLTSDATPPPPMAEKTGEAEQTR